MNGIVGLLLCLITAATVFREWGMDFAPLRWLTHAVFLAAMAILAPRVRWGRKVFILVALALTAVSAASQEDWVETVERGLSTAEFVVAFFCALSTLGNAAATSPAIGDCGRYLAQQPPGRRYAALTVGGQLFSLLLNYGSISLLGSLAVASAKEEKNPEIREHRTRRMLLAIERALVSTLPWSPLSFAFTLSSVLIAGNTWAESIVPCFINGVILAGTGWLLDTLFKPRLSLPGRGAQKPDGTIANVIPLLILLAVIGTSVLGLHVVTAIRVPGIVIAVVPLLSLAWIGLQNWNGAPVRTLSLRAYDFAAADLPAMQSEIVLLTMAGFIGLVGSTIAAPLVAYSGIDLAQLPPAIILVSIVWLIPIAGQLGMNPLLATSLLAPLLPAASDLGVEPAALLIATTAGWSLSGISSPYTAMAVIAGAFGGVSARHVALKWNGFYTLVAGVLLTFWVLAFALL